MSSSTEIVMSEEVREACCHALRHLGAQAVPDGLEYRGVIIKTDAELWAATSAVLEECVESARKMWASSDRCLLVCNEYYNSRIPPTAGFRCEPDLMGVPSKIFPPTIEGLQRAIDFVSSDKVIRFAETFVDPEDLNREEWVPGKTFRVDIDAMWQEYRPGIFETKNLTWFFSKKVLIP